MSQASGVVAVILSGSRFLVIQRSRHVRAPLKFCFPGGSIEPGEREEEALVRELDEELGARITPIELLWRSTTPWDTRLAWWHAQLTCHSPFLPQLQEVASFRWLTAAELAGRPDVLESNLHFLQAWRENQFCLPPEAGWDA